MTDVLDPADQLEAIRAANRAKTARWAAANADRLSAQRARERAADRLLHERHADEWAEALAAQRHVLACERDEGEAVPKATYRGRAVRAFRLKYQAEWDALLAAAS